MYPASSNANWPSKSSVFGVWPIATKYPSVSMSVASSVTMFLIVTPVTSSSPRTSSTTVFQRTSIFSWSRTRRAMMADARNSSRRWMIVTFEANFVRNRASSIAESPPPTTTSSLSRKKKPSQVAQADTPRPRSLSSPGMSNQRAEAPVAMITDSDSYSSAPTDTLNGRFEKSTSVTSTV